MHGAGVVLLLLAALAAGCGEEAVPGPVDLRLMSFNIRWEIPGRDGRNGWPHRREMVCRLLADGQLDVAGLQEATPAQLADILEAVPAMRVHDDDPRMNGIAILYRADRFALLASGAFWFSPTPDVPESRDWHSDTRRHVCAWVHLRHVSSGRAFYVYDLHLDQNRESRRLSAILLGERIAARAHADPAFVLGDFNAPEAEAASRYLRGEIALDQPGGARRIAEPLVDSFRQVHPDASAVGTGHAFRGEPRPWKIDYVYVPRGTRVLAAGIDRFHVDGRYPSDHFPVRATVRLSE